MKINNKLLTALFIIGSTAILGAVGVYGVQQEKLLRMMKVGFGGVTFKQITFSKVTLLLKLKFTNYSDIDIMVQNYNFDFLINGRQIVKILSPGPGYIGKKSDSITELTVSFSPTAVFSNVFSPQIINALLFDYSKVIMTLKGFISVQHSGLRVNDLPITENVRLDTILS